MVVYAVDERWPVSTFRIWSLVENKHRLKGTVWAVVDPLIQPGDDIATVVERIKEAVQKKGQGKQSIWLLRLCCHGYSGYLQLGKGMSWRDTTRWEKEWAKLADWMTPAGRGVEIWACGVASETDVREVGSRTASGRSEFRPGSIPKQFVKQTTQDEYYRRGRFGKMGGLGQRRQQRGETTLSLMYALSWALRTPVSAPIHAQPRAFTELHGPRVTVLSTPSQTISKLTLRPADRASITGRL